MPAFETFLIVVLALLGAAASIGLFLVLRQPPASPVMEAVGRGEFSAALETAHSRAKAGRDELYAAAVAAKHLLRLAEARGYLGRILTADPEDGEARIEAGLVAAYEGDFAAAEETFLAAAARRSDLAESITLHRAWVALRRGDRRAARRLFDEVEAPLESKLRSDLGSGDPLFAEWFLQAAALWEAFGDAERAGWARREGRASAPESRLAERVFPDLPDLPVQ
ncbi:MAG TPA: hypothetical protein VF756_07830 [Thermoanaerobaculia bacterium]